MTTEVGGVPGSREILSRHRRSGGRDEFLPRPAGSVCIRQTNRYRYFWRVGRRGHESGLPGGAMGADPARGGAFRIEAPAPRSRTHWANRCSVPSKTSGTR